MSGEFRYLCLCLTLIRLILVQQYCGICQATTVRCSKGHMRGTCFGWEIYGIMQMQCSPCLPRDRGLLKSRANFAQCCQIGEHCLYPRRWYGAVMSGIFYGDAYGLSIYPVLYSQQSIRLRSLFNLIIFFLSNFFFQVSASSAFL